MGRKLRRVSVREIAKVGRTQDTLIADTECEFEGFPNHPQVGSFMRKTEYSLKAVTLMSPSWH